MYDGFGIGSGPQSSAVACIALRPVRLPARHTYGTQLLAPEYDAFYSGLTKLRIKTCSKFYIPDNEVTWTQQVGGWVAGAHHLLDAPHTCR